MQEEFKEIERLIEIRRELFSMQNKTKRVFSSVVRAKGEMTNEFKKISDELIRVSQEFNPSIELIEEMIKLNCKKVV